MNQETGSPTSYSDRETLEILFEDPERGWRLLVSVHGETLKKVIGRFRFRRSDAQDVFQEVSIRLVRGDFQVLRKWEEEKGTLKTYLSVVTTRVCIDYRRKMKDHSEVPEGIPDKGPTPREEFRRKELLANFLITLEKWGEEGLKQKDRLLIEARMDDKSYKQIAEELGISEQNAMTRFSRLRPELLARLEAMGIGPTDFVFLIRELEV